MSAAGVTPELLPVRKKVGDAPQTEVLTFIRGFVGRSVQVNPRVETPVIADAEPTLQRLYEIHRREIHRRDLNRASFERAVGSLRAVNEEIAMLIRKTRGACVMSRRPLAKPTLPPARATTPHR